MVIKESGLRNIAVNLIQNVIMFILNCLPDLSISDDVHDYGADRGDVRADDADRDDALEDVAVHGGRDDVQVEAVHDERDAQQEQEPGCRPELMKSALQIRCFRQIPLRLHLLFRMRKDR